MLAGCRLTECRRYVWLLLCCLFVFATGCQANTQPPPFMLNQLPTATVVSPMAETSLTATPIDLGQAEIAPSLSSPTATVTPVATIPPVQNNINAGDEVSPAVLAQLQQYGVASDGVIIHIGKGQSIGQWVYAVAVPFL